LIFRITPFVHFLADHTDWQLNFPKVELFVHKFPVLNPKKVRDQTTQLRVLITFFFCNLFLIVISTQALAFTIKEPSSSTILKPGQQFTVRIDIGDVADIISTKFFWYGDQEDMLEEFVEEKLALVSTISNDPPFGGTIRVPRPAIGNLRLLAVAEKESNALEQEHWAIFDELILVIAPDSELQEIDFETEKPLGFGRAGSAVVYDQVDFLGKVFELPVVGIFADDVVRPIRLHTTGTTYSSSDEKVVTMNPDGLLRIVGNGRATITAKNRGKEATLEVVIEVNDEVNEPPVPDAGENKTVQAGKRVQFNALRSYDPEGGSLQYYWSQVGGSKVPLLDPYSPKASFLAPLVADTRQFRFKLHVTDAQGADSYPVFVDVTVEP